MNELVYSFIGSLRAWLCENESWFQANKINISIPAYTFHYGIGAQFTSDRFEAGFYVWEKRHWHVAMSDIEFADWGAADRDQDYQVEATHYEYATIYEMYDSLDALKNKLYLVQSSK